MFRAPGRTRSRTGGCFKRRSAFAPAGVHGVAASAKCRKSCSYFCREQSRQSEGIAVAMTRIVNAVIGKKNKTWCAYFMLAATPRRPSRAPLLSCLHPAVFVWRRAYASSSELGDSAAAQKLSPVAAQGYRFARWRGIFYYFWV